MRNIYYEQLRRHLEPESISIQSKTKSIATNSLHNNSTYGVIGIKAKQDVFQNQRPLDNFSSFDITTLA